MSARAEWLLCLPILSVSAIPNIIAAQPGASPLVTSWPSAIADKMEEYNLQAPEKKNISKLVFIAVLALIIIVLALIIIFLSKKPATIQDIAIESVDLAIQGNEMLPHVAIKNLGSKIFNESFYIYMETPSGMGIKWAFRGVIPPGETYVSKGAGTESSSGEYTFTLDAENKIQDINRENNIFKKTI